MPKHRSMKFYRKNDCRVPHIKGGCRRMARFKLRPFQPQNKSVQNLLTNRNLPNVADKWVTVTLRILKILGSNLGPMTRSPEIFPYFPQS
jgi:hypothetical protein